MSVGSLNLENVGALAAGPGRSPVDNLELFDWYSQKNAVPVIGWLGGNVLKSFRLTIDYPNRMMYWREQAGPDAHDLDQVGLTLRSEAGAYVVAAIAAKNGAPSVDGVLTGDHLIRVGGLDLRTATWGAIYDAMHGTAGESRTLVLERDGKRFAVTVKVTGF
jgi:hypothetical protein